MQTGNFQLVREINRRLIFGLIREGDDISRAGLVEVDRTQQGHRFGGGRRTDCPGMVSEGTAAMGVRRETAHLLGVNPGGPVLGRSRSNPIGVLGALTDLNGRVVEHFTRTCRVAEGRSLIRATVEMLKDFAAVSDGSERAILGVGVSVPGILNPPGDVVLSAPALGWRDVSLRRMLEADGRYSGLARR